MESERCFHQLDHSTAIETSRFPLCAVANPDLQISGGCGGGGGGRRSPKKFFSALRASVWSKNKGGGGPPEPLP